MYHIVAESEDAIASIWALAERMQCLAMLLRAAQDLCTGSVASISNWAIALKVTMYHIVAESKDAMASI